MVLKYSKVTLSKFMDPQHVGEMPDADGVGEEGNFKCGDVMKIFIKIKEDKIEKIRFQTYGCVAAIASTEMMCSMVEGMSVEEAKKVTPQTISQRLEDVPPIKHHCSILGTYALQKAIEDAQKKENKK